LDSGYFYSVCSVAGSCCPRLHVSGFGPGTGSRFIHPISSIVCSTSAAVLFDTFSGFVKSALRTFPPFSISVRIRFQQRSRAVRFAIALYISSMLIRPLNICSWIVWLVWALSVPSVRFAVAVTNPHTPRFRRFRRKPVAEGGGVFFSCPFRDTSKGNPDGGRRVSLGGRVGLGLDDDDPAARKQVDLWLTVVERN
jgi:hypothetical protein